LRIETTTYNAEPAETAERTISARSAISALIVVTSKRLFFAGFAAFALIVVSGCRQDMHDQPKYVPLRESTFFSDARSARPIVPGTVARGHLHDDDLLYTGRMNGTDATVFPFRVDARVMARGRERFNIYCSPCHGRTGQGDGMIVQRGYRRPTTFHQDRLRDAPVGHFFDVMTNGFGAMPDYAAQITADDRWAIIAYIRALQLSEHATSADVPASERDRIR
jgi:mono/diheme cytochrome c family protein